MGTEPGVRCTYPTTRIPTRVEPERLPFPHAPAICDASRHEHQAHAHSLRPRLAASTLALGECPHQPAAALSKPGMVSVTVDKRRFSDPAPTASGHRQQTEFFRPGIHGQRSPSPNGGFSKDAPPAWKTSKNTPHSVISGSLDGRSRCKRKIEHAVRMTNPVIKRLISGSVGLISGSLASNQEEHPLTVCPVVQWTTSWPAVHRWPAGAVKISRSLILGYDTNAGGMRVSKVEFRSQEHSLIAQLPPRSRAAVPAHVPPVFVLVACVDMDVRVKGWLPAETHERVDRRHALGDG